MASIQLKHFVIRGIGDETGEEELNRFLRGHQVLDVRQEFVSDGANSSWHIAVRYAGRSEPTKKPKRQRVDYKDVLEPEAFGRFVELRQRRKAIAEQEQLPAFAVFTDEELAGIAKLENPNPGALRSVKGIGEKKVERFGKHILGLVTEGDGETRDRNS